MKPLLSRLVTVSALLFPVVVAAETYVLVISTKEGQKYEIETQTIDKMEIVERAPVITALATPVVRIVSNSADGLTALWERVEGAAHYAYSIDGADEATTADVSINLRSLGPGKHSLAVAAVPSVEDKTLKRSETSTIDFDVAFKITIKQVSVGREDAEFSFTPGYDNIEYLAAVIPSSIGTDVERIAKVRTLAAADGSLRHTGSTTVKFGNLTSGENYQVVAFEADSNAPTVYTERFMTMSDSYKPGASGTIFPPGVDQNGGFIDVDKVGSLTKYGYSGSDDELCWACSTAGMIQWWLNDYKRATGEEYRLRIALPEKSQCYSTPVMDVLAQAFYHDAGNPTYVMQWFFTGMPQKISSYTVNNHPAFNADYEHVNGNFANFTKADYDKYISKEQNSYYLYKDMTESEVKVRASADIIGWLKAGPVYLSINRGNHAITLWGVKYTVDINSNPIITQVYFAENDLLGGNIQNGLNTSSVSWVAGDGPHMFSTNGANVEINSFMPMKGYSTAK